MRLLSITLTHFGYYDRETIDLSGISACTVIGQNGTGKSTGLVDAPLWAFFEQCRGKADEMIKPGELDMSVEVVWQQDGRTYQVIRKRSKRTKAGKSELALHVKDGEDWQSISCASIAATQEKIEALLGLDYDLLTKTAFILQGQADAFSKAKPTERKAVLASILRLDRYAMLKSAANAEANKLSVKADSLQRELITLSELVKTIPALRDKAEAIQTAMHALEAGLSDVGARRTELVARKAALEAEQASRDADRRAQAELQQRLHELSKRMADLNAARMAHEAVLADAPDIRAAAEEAEEARQQAERLDQTIQHDLEPKLSALADKLVAIEADRHALQNLQLRYQSAKRDLDLLVQGYQAETKRLSEDLARDHTTVKLLDKVPCGTDLQRKCQFTLNAAKIQDGLSAKTTALDDRPKDPTAIAQKVASDLYRDVVALDAERRAKETTIDQQAYQAMVAERSQLTITRDGLRAERNALLKIMDSARDKASKLPAVEKAEELLPGLDADIDAKSAELGSVTMQLGEVNDRLSRAQATAAAIVEIAGSLASLDATDKSLRGQLNDQLVEQGRCQESLTAAEKAAPDAERLSQDLKQLVTDRHQYSALAEAYALIPVLVMESSIPILEREANDILGRISSTGLRVRLETQKALASRDGLAETLDIVASDRKCERRYELYSGGERFRLDLALRIGLSKLLANRAGAKLETLVIDEGLGSLDEDGLTQLRECLSALGSEFKCVIVITHVEAMKSTFPSQIFVSADADGSHVKVYA